MRPIRTRSEDRRARGGGRPELSCRASVAGLGHAVSPGSASTALRPIRITLTPLAILGRIGFCHPTGQLCSSQEQGVDVLSEIHGGDASEGDKGNATTPSDNGVIAQPC